MTFKNIEIARDNCVDAATTVCNTQYAGVPAEKANEFREAAYTITMNHGRMPDMTKMRACAKDIANYFKPQAINSRTGAANLRILEVSLASCERSICETIAVMAAVIMRSADRSSREYPTAEHMSLPNIACLADDMSELAANLAITQPGNRTENFKKLLQYANQMTIRLKDCEQYLHPAHTRVLQWNNNSIIECIRMLYPIKRSDALKTYESAGESDA